MSDKQLEDKLKTVARDCNPKVRKGWVWLEGEVSNDAQMRQMDIAMRIVEEHNRK